MATDTYRWRTAFASQKFVCSYTGSDLFGDGTQAKPYKTFTKSYYTSPSSGIVCRGIFTDNLTGGHNTRIDADYYGAAVWDGQNVSNLYGFQHSNMVFINSNAATGGFVGVGCAYHANAVGSAYVVYGLAGSSALLDNCGTYFGVLGGTSAVNNIVYSRIKPNLDYKINLVTYGGNQANFNNTVFGIPKLRMTRSIQGIGFINSYWLFSQTAIYIDQTGTFNRCMFSSDCTWWFSSGVTSGGIEVFSAIAAAGSGYAVGDIITVGGTGSGCTVPVKTVGGTGNVTALGHIINAGSGYNISNGKPTTTNGTGTGLTLSVIAGGLNNQFIPYKSYGTLSGGITDTDTTIPYTLVGTQAIPQVGIITLNGEDISYTGNTGTTLTGCTRGVNTTTAIPHTSGTLTSGEMASIIEKRRVLNTGVIFDTCKYTNQPATLIQGTLATPYRINLYDANVNWEYVTFGNYTNFYTDSTTQFTPTGATNELKMDSIIAAANALGTKCTLFSCRYATEESVQLFNNAQKQDYSLNPMSDAVLKILDPTFPAVRYYGALKPALNIPILSSSTGRAGTWDEKTLDQDGLLYIENNEIHFRETGYNLAGTVKVPTSSITSKVVPVNKDQYLVDGIKSILFPVFNSAIEVEGATYSAGDSLPVGKYKVYGTAGAKIAYRRLAADPADTEVTVGGTFYIVRTGCVFTNVGGNVSTVKILSNSTQKFYLGESGRTLVDTTKILQGVSIPAGTYIVCGGRITHLSALLSNATVVLSPGDTLVTTISTSTFTNIDSGAYLLNITDPNVTNPILVRATDTLGAIINANTTFSVGQTYLNHNLTAITVNIDSVNYSIAPQESFVAKTINDKCVANSVTAFMTTNNNEWMTVTAFEDLWNMTNGGAQVYTDTTRPASSGNAKAWALTGNVKNVISKTYLQFKLVLNQYDTV